MMNLSLSVGRAGAKLDDVNTECLKFPRDGHPVRQRIDTDHTDAPARQGDLLRGPRTVLVQYAFAWRRMPCIA